MRRFFLRLSLIAAITLAAIAAAAALLIFVVFNDNMSAHYATAAEARAGGAFSRGWLPRAMPDSSFDIAEEHNLDSNRGSGTFRFAAEDAETFRARLQPANPAGGNSVDGSKLLSQGYSFHAFEDFILAVNWQTGAAEFWLNDDRK